LLTRAQQSFCRRRQHASRMLQRTMRDEGKRRRGRGLDRCVFELSEPNGAEAKKVMPTKRSAPETLTMVNAKEPSRRNGCDAEAPRLWRALRRRRAAGDRR
jgi:hypothetical protein